MKKKNIIIAIVVLVIIGIVSFFLYQNNTEEKRKYELEKIEETNYFIVRQEGKYGIINKNGDIIINPDYDNIVIPNPEKAVFVCYEGEESKVLNDKKEEILSNYEEVQPIQLKNVVTDYIYEKSVLTYTKEGKIGLISLEGKKITKPIYDEITALPYKEGELLVKQDEKYGVINIKGNELVKLEYNQISTDIYYEENSNYVYSGYIVGIKTEEGYRYGYIDVNGKQLLLPEFNAVSRITEIKNNNKEIYLIASKNGQYGLYKNGEQLIPNEYVSMRYDNTNRVVVVEKGKKYGVMSIEGKSIIPIEYTQIDITGQHIYAKQNDNTVVVFNKDGSKSNLDSNISIIRTNNEKYSIKIDTSKGEYSIIDSNSNQLTKQKYSYLAYLYDDYFIASTENGKLGVIDISENQKIEIKYNSIEKIQDTKMIKTTITDDKTMQIYSSSLNQVCEMPDTDDTVIEVINNYVKIYDKEETKYFDLEGNEKNNTTLFSNNMIFASKKDGKWGYIDKEGNVKVDYVYDKVTDINNYGFGAVMKDNKWGVVDKSGNIILEPTYETNSNKEPEFIKEYRKVEYGFGGYYFEK